MLRRRPHSSTGLQTFGWETLTNQNQSQQTQQNQRTCLQKQGCRISKKTQRSQRKITLLSNYQQPNTKLHLEDKKHLDWTLKNQNIKNDYPTSKENPWDIIRCL